ncbi:putative bifunctional diguanylate cyclase/phosphodiesterase [Massilia endophytica]|uniref:putative bifunctional diguanylate cyclase/phosphodiesterase n=1 Tax=Massilia endophytica TaxID=2899220 RepID=UPI001E4FD15E|nr:GGDEF domain-containing phosphodiesterase [Massilia endophytica]UGQ46903.1 EAL domain-containing protein [Massilia endophytica]
MEARDHLAHWRAQIFARILLVVVLLGALTAVPSVFLAASEGLWSVVVIDTGAMLWIAAIWRLKRLSYRVRAINFLAAAFIVGTGLLLKVGPVSQIYLMAVPVLTALLLGLRPALCALFASALAVLVIGYGATPGTELVGLPEQGLLKGVILAMNFLFITSVITLSCAVLLRHLERSLEELHKSAESLENGRNALQALNMELLATIQERDRSAEDIHQLAFYDHLTGLPNRRLLLDRIAGLLASSARNATLSAVLFIDLDRFKYINDARGHATGDALLKSAATRLLALVRKTDTVARIGGDEFVVLLAHVGANIEGATSTALRVAENVRRTLAEEFEIDGHAYTSSASIGVSLLPKEGQTADDLLREADTAMYRAKSLGRNSIAFFEDAMQADVERRLTMESQLATALDQGQLQMHFQPQFDSQGKATGAELLMRWPQADGSMVPPSVFIPLAEESGLIVRLGLWALREACHALRELAHGGHVLPLSVNVSPTQFRQPDFVQTVRQVLEETGAPAHLLILEVTEGLLVEKLDETIARMRELNAMGLRFSIDDFGTGYSSLAYLKKMPLYELKIDRSFIMDTPEDANDTAIVQSILAMAGHLGLRVVAEGVESREQSAFLSSHRCDAMQGYLFARPAPLAALLALLQADALAASA